jgi:hypothetical protein
MATTDQTVRPPERLAGRWALEAVAAMSHASLEPGASMTRFEDFACGVELGLHYAAQYPAIARLLREELMTYHAASADTPRALWAVAEEQHVAQMMELVLASAAGRLTDG